MIQKGIIAQVIDKYTYKVRIPKYDKIEHATNSTKLEDLSSGIVCTIPGIDIAYTLGDVVLVSFENDEISKPIILGLLYRENKSDADISVSNVDSSLIEIQNNLDKINSSNLYTHIKYSNDNGLTFTSLFSPLYHESIINGEVVCQPLFDTDENVNGIKIDKRTRVINWSIIDSDNNDVTRNVSIETTVFDSEGDIIKKTNKDDNEYNITINNSSKIDGDLYLTYKLFITKEYLDTLHVLLATDREPIGTTPGDYIGISLSTNSIPSISPTDYSWLSFSALNSNINIDINNKIAKLSAELNAKLEELTDVVYYKEVTWTQSEVDEYCQTGYQAIWTRDLENGYIGEIKEGSIFYISVHNIGDDISSSEDDSYGRLTLKASMDAGDTEDVLGTVIEYLVSGEIAINALARFKSDLLAPNDQTLIYGGHITTGHIQDYTGKNFIQLTDESGRGKAGHLEFKNANTWEASTSGLQWDTYYEPAEEIPENLKGTLSVKGDIYANSLTIIGADGNSYSGTAAINIGGYKIDIEKNPTDYIEDVSVYLYPILYHNGEKLDEYIISSDIEVDSSKTYYEKIGDVYEEIQDPDPSSNPHELGWYEKQIDYTHFVWYEDDITPGTTGDPDRGKILATYGHIYKVTYDFDDGAVGEGTEIQTREVDPSKYITKTGDESITVHPEYWENRSSYISLNTDGLNIFNRYGNSIAQYGSTARIGLDNSSRFLMNSGSLEAYDSSNNKYFEVNSNGLSWGNNLNNSAATTADLANKANISYILSEDTTVDISKTYYTRSGSAGNYTYTEVVNPDPSINPHTSNYYEKQDTADAAKTATNYITYIDSSNGIKVHDITDDTSYAKINSAGMQVYQDNDEIASFGAVTRIGKAQNSNNVEITSDRMRMISYTNVPAFDIVVPSDEALVKQQVQTPSYFRENYGWTSYDEDYSTIYCTDKLTISSSTETSTNAKTIVDDNVISAISILDNGDEFTIIPECSLKISDGQTRIGGLMGFPVFTKGTASTRTVTYNYNLDVLSLCTKATVAYNGTNGLTLTISGYINSYDSTGRTYTIYGDIYGLYSDQFTLKNYAYLNGDVMVCSFPGQQSQFTSGYFGIMGRTALIHYDEDGEDSWLQTLLSLLNWREYVVAGLTIKESLYNENTNTSTINSNITSKSIPLSGGPNNDVYAHVVPDFATVIWTSSNTNVATVSIDNEYATEQVTITPVATGTCVITAEINLLKRKWTASFTLTVT